MSTRTRIVLKCPGFEATGAFAVKSLIQSVIAPYGLNFQYPPAWNQMTKREKLAWLAGKLPPKYKLELFQEPRGTRLKQSLYHASLVNKKQKRRHPLAGQAKKHKIAWNFEAAAVRPVDPVAWPNNNNVIQQQVQPVLREVHVDDLIDEERIYRDFEPIPDEEI